MPIPCITQYSQQGLRLHPITKHTGMSAVNCMHIRAEWDMSFGTKHMKKLSIFRALGVVGIASRGL